MAIQRVKGTFDLFPDSIVTDQWLSSSLWKELEVMIHSLAARWGYEEIRTPMLESTELFEKTSGTSSDVCMKQMYSFLDKGGRSIVLRPEGTPSIIRALGEEGCFHHGPKFRKRRDIYYLGQMFRHERPQSGRYRQFTQFGVETIGPDQFQIDCEVILLGAAFLKELKIPYLILLNSLGTRSEIFEYRKALLDYLNPLANQLSEDSQRRLSTNVLRILDSKDEMDRKIIDAAPLITDVLQEESLKRFEKIQGILKELEVPFTIEPKLVRGLDYYNNIIFEYIWTDQESPSALGGGGRYNQLIQSMGYTDLPGVGFAFGFERVIQAAIANGFRVADAAFDLLFISLLESSSPECFRLSNTLRENRIRVKTRFGEKNLGNALKECDQIGVKWILIYGEQEKKRNMIQLKNAKERTTQIICLDDTEKLLSILRQ
ncbi:histidine--tRNA ligase [Candidatus Similichlamydia epinepheli]|uniref:histidine--tRNA ligase n=1 Tax=Candidatus Similichlamydia epinepheli TaxID=1903953 RepID=UPI000D3B4E02|nr:histidine--tRNA ligase [Candidatus Similichlamydia epinepheli]